MDTEPTLVDLEQGMRAAESIPDYLRSVAASLPETDPMAEIASAKAGDTPVRAVVQVGLALASLCDRKCPVQASLLAKGEPMPPDGNWELLTGLLEKLGEARSVGAREYYRERVARIREAQKDWREYACALDRLWETRGVWQRAEFEEALLEDGCLRQWWDSLPRSSGLGRTGGGPIRVQKSPAPVRPVGRGGTAETEVIGPYEATVAATAPGVDLPRLRELILNHRSGNMIGGIVGLLAIIAPYLTERTKITQVCAQLENALVSVGFLHDTSNTRVVYNQMRSNILPAAAPSGLPLNGRAGYVLGPLAKAAADLIPALPRPDAGYCWRAAVAAMPPAAVPEETERWRAVLGPLVDVK